ncbi:MAG: glycosyltransferase family 2 protein [Chloroflexota bacterium]
MAISDAFDLTAVIVSYNTRELLRRCLITAYAAAAADGLSLEVVVVDNASADGSAAMVATEFPGAALVANERNFGFAAASNAGLRQAQGRWLLLLNPDTELRAGALAVMLATVVSDARAACVGPSLVYGDGSPQHSCFRFPTVTMQFLDLFPLHHRLLASRLNGRFPLGRREPFPIDHPLGACMLLRREALAAVGLLDEGFFIYVEEVDWCWRAKKAGWRILCEPRAVVVHHGAQSTKQFAEPMFVELYRSRFRMFAKHYAPWRRAAVRAVIRLGMAQMALRDSWAAARGRLGREQLLARRRAYAQVARM